MRELYGMQLRAPIVQHGFQTPQPFGQFIVISRSSHSQAQAVLPARRPDGKVGVAIYGYAAPSRLGFCLRPRQSFRQDQPAAQTLRASSERISL